MRSPLDSAEVPCVRCLERVAGLAWGDRCPRCLRERKGRARRLARRISLVAALLAAVMLGFRGPVTETFRVFVGIGALATYLLVHMIALRVAMEFLPD